MEHVPQLCNNTYAARHFLPEWMLHTYLHILVQGAINALGDDIDCKVVHFHHSFGGRFHYDHSPRVVSKPLGPPRVTAEYLLAYTRS